MKILSAHWTNRPYKDLEDILICLILPEINTTAGMIPTVSVAPDVA